MWVKDSNPRRQKTSSKYLNLVERRKEFMDKYAKKDIEEDFYLQRMGAISLKLARVAHKAAATEDVAPDHESENDSLSETRPLPVSAESHSSGDSDEEVGVAALSEAANRLLNKETRKPNQKGKEYCTLFFAKLRSKPKS